MKILRKFATLAVISLVYLNCLACSPSRQFLKSDSPKDIRVVYVKAVADEEYRGGRFLFFSYETNWKQDIKEMIDGASQDFEKEFGIRFVIKEIGEWKSDNRIKENEPLLCELIRTVKIEDGINVVLGFTGQVFDIEGRAVSLGHYILMGPQRSKYIIGHEFGHIFGAEDIYNNTSSIMNRYGLWNLIRDGSKYSGPHFDKKNAERIMRNKYCSFKPWAFYELLQKQKVKIERR